MTKSLIANIQHGEYDIAAHRIVYGLVKARIDEKKKGRPARKSKR